MFGSLKLDLYRLADYAEKIANKMATLEFEKENLVKQLNVERERVKK